MKDSAQMYNLYGLRVHSEIALPAPIARNDGQPYDLHIRWGECKAISDGAPAGEILAKLLLHDGRGYTLVDSGRGYALYFHQTGEFRIDYDVRSVCVHLAPGIDPDIAALLVAGNVMACVLTLAGEFVLHASAVEIGGSALAFLGGSGMGKSSLAALLCTNGARFVTDDLLRLQPDGKGWRCFPGTGQLRLRKSAAALIEKFPLTIRDATPDDRVAVKLDDDPSMPLLGVIVIPRLSRSARALKLERIPPSKALLYLIAYLRIQETTRKEQRQRQLDFLGRIVANVPIFEAIIPWGLPFPRKLAASLVRGVGAYLH